MTTEATSLPFHSEPFEAELATPVIPLPRSPQQLDLPLLEVVDVIPGKPQQVGRIGYYTNDRIILTDGETVIAYDRRHGEPYHQRFGRLAVATNAWCTENEGFNGDFDDRLLSHGVETHRVSAPYVLRRTSNAPELTEAHDISAYYGILNHDVSNGTIISQHATEGYVLSGDSRGAMVGSGMVNKAFMFDLRDACIEHPVTAQEFASLEKLFYFLKEGKTTAVQVAKSGRLRHLSKSVDLTPSAVKRDIAVGKTIFRGESGGFVRRIRSDANGRFTFFENSDFNHYTDYQHNTAHAPGVHVVKRPGVHMTLIEWKQQMQCAERLVLALRAETMSISLGDIDWSQDEPSLAA